MKRACIGTLALALAAAGLSARAEDYYWNGDVREGAWETPGNWYHDDSFPNADDAVAIFSNWGDRTGTATVTVSGNYLFRWGSIGGSVKATLKGTGIDTSSLTFGTDLYDTLYLNAPQPAIFDNMRFVVNGAIAFANNSSIVLDNQAELDINREGGLSLYNPCGFELHNDSKLVANVSIVMLNANQVIIIDDSEFVVNRQLSLACPYEGNRCNGQKIEFYGTHPKLQLNWQLVSGVDDGNGPLDQIPEFVFHVPYDDYEGVPVDSPENVQNFDFNVNGHQGIKFTVDPKSPRFKRREHTWEKLVNWPHGIFGEGIDTSAGMVLEQENSRVTLYWAYGAGGKDDKTPTYDGEKPTALWAEFIPSGYFVILR